MNIRSITYELKLIFRLLGGSKKYEEYVWRDLKEYHSVANYNSGIYENEKKIESVFNISETKVAYFTYDIFNGKLHFRVKVLNHFNPEIATEIFVLATHINNLLKEGIVIVDTNNSCVILHMKTHLLVNLFYVADKHHITKSHYSLAKDLHWAFLQLIEKKEEPALIIADLLEKQKENQ